MQNIIRKGYIGNPAQLVTLRRVTVSEGRSRGVEIIEVRTAGGLDLDILPDAGLDIGQCRYKGVNMSWMSKNGYDSPAVIDPYENEFVNTFPGGLLYTCGLRSAGPANRDNGEWHPLHGRYHGLQAQQVCAEIEGDEIVVPEEGLTLVWNRIPSGSYQYCFGLTDLSGQVHYTDSVAIDF